MIEKGANINRIHLSSQAFKRRIDADDSAIPAETRMQINTIFSGEIWNVFGSRFQFGQRNESLRRTMIKKKILEPIDHVRIRNNPVAARTGKKTVMAVILRRPKHLGCFAASIIFENKIAADRTVSAGRYVPAVIDDVI